jgi:cytochrome c oxidase subunit 1
MRKVLTILLLSVVFSLIPLTIIWTHHQFITGLNPFLALLIITFISSIAFLIYYFLKKHLKGHISFTPDKFFAIGLISCIILIFELKIANGNSALDIHLHDTYFVISNSYPLSFIALTFAVIAATYYWCDKVLKKPMNKTLGNIHFWITFLGISAIVLPIQYAGLAGMPRRYYDYSDSSNFNIFSNQITFVSVLTFLLVIAQLLFVFNFCYSILRKTK